MRIAIAGASAAGLFASLLLARAGHQVLVLEQEALDASRDVESAAAAAFRATAPQIVQPHAVMARCRELFRHRLPDVFGRLVAAGAVEAPLSAFMPPMLTDRSARQGDERLTLLLTRRSTVDLALLRAALDEPGIDVRCGVRVAGLVTAPGRPGTPSRVTGLRTGDAKVGADLVIDATGRRSPFGRWLVQAGTRPPVTRRAECGLAYFGRHYRLRSAAGLPGPPATRMVMGLDEFTAVLFGADNQVMQLAVAPLAADHRFRAVRQPEVFTAVLRTIPAFAAWLDVLDPISPVFVMGGLHNTLRRLVTDGDPVVTGLHAIGDAVCTTNPTLGRGLALALQGAIDVADTLDKHPDSIAQALALDHLITEHVAPYYEDQAVIDEERLAMLRRTVFGVPPSEPSGRDAASRVTFAELRAAGTVDPVAFRAFWQVLGMVSPPDQVYTDPGVVAATRAVLADPLATAPLRQPTRADLLTVLTRPS